MLSHVDTIVAPITPPGVGAVATIRLSGSNAWDMASQLFSPWPNNPKPRLALYGKFTTGDDGIALPFAENNSYTGEETIEFTIHGSPVSVQKLIEKCISKGARLAKPGEFTQRAFLNGKLDLTQAEGIRSTIESKTDRQFQEAIKLKSGKLGEELQEVKKLFTQVLAMVEATTDFSEEVGDLNEVEASKIIKRANENIKKLLQTESATKLLHQGLLIVIAGRPNAGKSSLLNTIIQRERSIVTNIPGTTRDTVEEQISIRGIPITLVDTAGLRRTNDEVEQIGVERAKQYLENANAVLYVYDQSEGWNDEDEQTLRHIPSKVIVLANKSDLTPSEKQNEKAIFLSLSTLSGLDILMKELETLTQSEEAEPSYLLDRHYAILHKIDEVLNETLSVFSNPVPNDLAASTLRTTLRLIGEITGETASPDMIDQIFGDFCIGK